MNENETTCTELTEQAQDKTDWKVRVRSIKGDICIFQYNKMMKDDTCKDDKDTVNEENENRSGNDNSNSDNQDSQYERNGNEGKKREHA